MLVFIAQGLRNDFKDAMDKLDQEYLDQLAKHEVCIIMRNMHISQYRCG